MVKDNTTSRKAFVVFNTIVLLLIAVSCLVPYIHVLAVSLSSRQAVMGGAVTFWPIDFTLGSYQFVLQKRQFLSSAMISFERVLLGVTINMILVIMVAYPLSKDKRVFRSRTVYAWIFVFTMFFGVSLVPWYLTVRSLGLVDSIWALVLPTAVPVFNVTILLNFFRQLPRELEESAFIDGAGHFVTLFKIYIPASTPALATLTLFSIVTQWNSWFDGLIFMNMPDKYPLQTFMQTMLIQSNPQYMRSSNVRLLRLVSERTVRSAQIFLAALPVLIAYPFLQKYFIKGIVLGSVKG